MRWVSRFASAKIRGLLRLLFVWLGAVPAGATGAKLLLRYQRRRCTLSHNQDAPSTRRLACFVRPHTRTRSVMQIRVDDLTGTEVRALLAEHLRNMHQLSPPESVHALDLTALLKPEITFWTVWFHGELLGCGALKELTPAHGEIKSMRTASTHRRKGVARATLQHIIAEARRRSYTRLSLETGTFPAFEPARRLYETFGFTYCSPFAGYTEDPNSVFLTRTLEQT